MKRAKRAIKHLRTIVGRVMRDVERKIQISGQINSDQKIRENLAEVFSPILNQTKQLLVQERNSKNKIYSLHEPDVACISKGKARQRYEFGCKVSLAVTNKQGLVVSSEALLGNPYDGHTLNQTLASAEEITGTKIDSATVDKGYKGHGIEDVTDRNHTKIFISGHNLRLILNHIRKLLKLGRFRNFLAQIFYQFLDPLLPKTLQRFFVFG